MSLNVATPSVTVAPSVPVTVAPSVPVTVAPSVPGTASYALSLLLNSTLMSVLSIGRERYAPKTATSCADEYDYIVVGAGSAGSVVASRLSEKCCVSVLLLEAGKQPHALTEVPAISRLFEHTDMDWAYKTTPQKYSGFGLENQQIPWPSGKVLGGSSVLNAVFYIRGNHESFDKWAAAGAEGWSYKDVLPYFKKAEDINIQDYAYSYYHNTGGPITVERPRYTSELFGPLANTAKDFRYEFLDINGERQTGFADFQATMRGGQKCSTAKGYLVPAENRTNLCILPNAMVRKVIIENKRAVGVEYDYLGKTHVVRARREVILSAGTINTAQLLMLSGIGPKEELKKHKIAIVEDLPVGENFHDHCSVVLLFEITNSSVVPATVKLFSPVSIADYVTTRSGPLASAQMLILTAMLKGNETHPLEDSPNTMYAQFEGGVDFLPTVGVRKDVYAKSFALYTGKPMLICESMVLQPRSRGTVTLHSSDPYDYPNINPNYFQEEHDVNDVVSGLKNCIRMSTGPRMTSFGVVPLKTLLSGCEQYANDMDKYLGCYARSLPITPNHQVGTARMGNPNDKTTVVDPLLRVKNIKGLRVIDCSVMPIIPTGNTNAAAIMVGRRKRG